MTLIEGKTKPEWKLNEITSPKMHKQQFFQLSYIDLSSVLLLGSNPGFAR